ncbi:HPr family phosphocarrier protein, partial [Brevundimonas sp.]
MSVTATLDICNARGLHARASAKFVKLASSFD